MSDGLSVRIPSPVDDAEGLAAALAAVPLFAGMSHDDVVDFASVFKPVELSTGEVLWRQATPVDGLHVLLSGEVRVTRRLPGERDIEVARLGPGAVMGDVPLLGGGTHSATVRADSPCSLVFLHRKDFHARMQSGQPSALVLKRRIVEIACARVRADHAALAASLDGTPAAPATDTGSSVARLPVTRPVAMPSPAYVSRLPFFRDLDADLVSSLLDCGETLLIAPRSVMLGEAETPSHCYVTLNGAVEDVLRRGGRAVRVRFAGPGRAFGYLGLLDGGVASATSVARERTVVLAIEAQDFRARLEERDDLGRAFAAAIERDLMAMLRSTGSPKAHVATAGAR
jgi:CRP-like cAMP-binding protein